MRCHFKDIVHFIKHAAQVGEEGATNGKAIACSDGRATSIFYVGWDLLGILCELCLPVTELLLCVLYSGTESLSIGEVAALGRGGRA